MEFNRENPFKDSDIWKREGMKDIYGYRAKPAEYIFLGTVKDPTSEDALRLLKEYTSKLNARYAEKLRYLFSLEEDFKELWPKREKDSQEEYWELMKKACPEICQKLEDLGREEYGDRYLSLAYTGTKPDASGIGWYISARRFRTGKAFIPVNLLEHNIRMKFPSMVALTIQDHGAPPPEAVKRPSLED